MLNNDFVSFNTAKSSIISSALGKALGLTTSSTIADIATKISGVANRGAVSKTFTPSSSSQSYTIPKGYHNGSGKVTCNAISSLSSTNILSSNGTGVWGANGSVASLSYKATEACYVVVALESYQHNNGGSFAHTVSGGTTIKDSGNIGTYSGNLRVMLIKLAKDATLTMKVESTANTYSHRSVAYIAFKI